MSEMVAPARRAIAMPSPSAPGGLVVRAYSAPAPPVAISVIRDRSGRSSSWPITQAPAQPPPSAISSSIAVCSSTLISGWERTRAISTSAMCWPVALPPACRIRRRPWPPSRPSARWPSPVAVERDAHALQVGDPGRGIGHQQLDRARVAEPASDQHRVGHVL